MSEPQKTPIYKTIPGPIMVLAGPGTGKTHSMAMRVKWLVTEQNVKPEDITVITFTSEAAMNMRHRLSDEEKKDVFLPRELQPAQISTMHSLGLQIISNDLNSVKLRENFKLLESDVIRKLLFEDSAQIFGLPRSRGHEALAIKSSGISINIGHDLWNTSKYYDSILRASNFIDYDDQILLAIDLLVSNPGLLTQYQKRALHLLVDEYQDINKAQFDLIKLLAGKKAEGLFVVGDDDQSIYAFRGASPEYVRDFVTHFGERSRVLEISECRRCPPLVLKSAITIASAFNQKRLRKIDPSFLNLVSTPVQVISSPTAEKEAEYIASKCSKVTPSHDVLILVPHLKFAKPLVKALRQKRVAFDCRSIISEEGLLVLDVLGRWLVDPDDNFALRQTIQALIELKGFGVPSNRVRKPEKIAERDKYLSEISSLWSHVIHNNQSLYDSLVVASENSKFLRYIREALDQLLSAYSKSSTEFFDALRLLFLPWDTPIEMFQEISNWIDEIRGRSTTGQSAVRVMSMRLAKGLEADYVFVVGLEEGVFPSSNLKLQEIEEASRLLFVSMTRAKMNYPAAEQRGIFAL